MKSEKLFFHEVLIIRVIFVFMRVSRIIAIIPSHTILIFTKNDYYLSQGRSNNDDIFSN